MQMTCSPIQKMQQNPHTHKAIITNKQAYQGTGYKINIQKTNCNFYILATNRN